MEPLAAAGYLLIASAALDGIIVGALGGAISWAVKGRRLWIGVLVAGIYVAMVLRASYSLKTGAVFGIPLSVLTFLISWLTASYLQARTRLKTIWATPLATCCALIAGSVGVSLPSWYEGLSRWRRISSLFCFPFSDRRQSANDAQPRLAGDVNLQVDRHEKDNPSRPAT